MSSEIEAQRQFYSASTPEAVSRYFRDGIYKVAIPLARHGVVPQIDIINPQDLSDIEKAEEIFAKVEVLAPEYQKIDPGTLEGKKKLTELTVAKGLAIVEQNPKTKSQIGRRLDDLLDGMGKLVARIGGKKGMAAAGALAFATAACSPSVIVPPLPDGGGVTTKPTATETAGLPTQSATETAAATATSTPEAAKSAQGLTPADLEKGKWGDYTFSENPAGYYEIKDAQGNLIPDIKFFKDGTAELNYKFQNKSYDLTIADQVVTQEKGSLIVGLWEYKDKAWSMETYKAPKTEEETKSWRSLVVILGHEKEQQMIDTIFTTRKISLAKTDTYDPANEFKNISVTFNFKTTDNFDPRPKYWKLLNGDPAIKGVVYVLPQSRGEFSYDWGRLGYARPIQVVLDTGWFGLKILDEKGGLTEDALYSPVIGMNADGTLTSLNAAVNKAKIKSISQYFSREKRGNLIFELYTLAISVPDSFVAADKNLIAFSAKVDKGYRSTPDYPKTYTSVVRPTLPSQFDKLLLLMVDASTY